MGTVGFVSFVTCVVLRIFAMLRHRVLVVNCGAVRNVIGSSVGKVSLLLVNGFWDVRVLRSGKNETVARTGD